MQCVVFFSPGSQLSKGKRLFLLQITLCASVSSVSRKRDSLPQNVADTRDGKDQRLLALVMGGNERLAQPSSPNANNSSLPPRQKINLAFVLDARRCFASFPSRFTRVSQICSCYSHG